MSKGVVYGIQLKVDHDKVFSHLLFSQLNHKWHCTLPGCSYIGAKTHAQYHVYAHFRLKPFQCIQCSYRVNKPSNLIQHHRLAHRF